MHKIIILQKSLPQYREAFFTGLRNKLAEDNISLEFIYGSTNEGRRDGITLDWATYKKNKQYSIGPLKLIWQPCLKEIAQADLVIVEQADKLLINYILFFRKMFGKQKFAFWGHGLNKQAGKYSIRNLYKRLFLKRSNWWFAYTSGTKKFLIKNGFAENKITIVENAIDTKGMIRDYNEITDIECKNIRNKYGIAADEKLLIYCGALYKEKRLEFLIASTDALIKSGYKIKLMVVGSGPDENIVREAAQIRPYILFTGPLFAKAKAEVFKISDVFLLPGAIGLAVLDSFAFETPIITTTYKYHGPEFEYLVNDFNSIITENNLEAYVSGVKTLLDNEAKLVQIKLNCKDDSKKYSNENMVNNFAEGIINYLKMQ